MTDRFVGTSPRLRARIAGVLYLIIIIAASFAEFFARGRLVVGGDAAANATNILAHELLYRLGAAAVLIYLSCDTAVALIFYELFKPVSRSLSLLASFVRLMQVAILGGNLLNHLAPLVLLKGAPFLTAFKSDQLQALALVSLNLYAQAFFIAMVFFGFHCFLIGYLICRSAFLPRVLGVLMAIAGLGYVTHSFALFLSPALAAHLFPYLMALGLPWGTIAHPVAPRARRQGSTMERAGQPRGRTPMKSPSISDTDLRTLPNGRPLGSVTDPLPNFR